MFGNQLILKYALKYPLWNLLSIILGFSGALFNGVSTTLIVPVVLNFLGQEIELNGTPPVIGRVMSVFDGFSGDYRLAAMVTAILLAIILKNVTTYVSGLTSSHLSRLLMNDLRREGLRLLLEVDLDFYAKSKVGDLVNRLSNEITRTSRSIRSIFQIVTTIITILVFLAILLSISWQLTIASTVLLTLVVIINQYFVQRAKIFGQMLSDNSRLYSSNLFDILAGIRLVKSTSTEEDEYEKLDELISEREKAEFKSQANGSAIGPINEVTGVMAVLAIVILGRAFFAFALDSLSAVLLTYLYILFRLLPIVGQLNRDRGALANATASVDIVADFLRRDNKSFMKSGPIIYRTLESGIAFENVSFAYPGYDSLVLRNVSLQIPKGSTLALVGSSGAGKSTIADILPRFYDPTDGRITIDGKDLKDYDLHSLRRAMGIVSQDTFVFNDSVRNNIAYGYPSASDEDVMAAAKRANAYEFITQLSQGFETQLGDRGVLLSGGQRQRIAIARALLSNPEILILDEATSALDTVSERLVQQAIEELSRDRTTLVIAHRLSTVQRADQIAVLEKGAVVEIGSHEELLGLNGHYTRLYNMQFMNNQPPDALKLVQKDSLNEALLKSSYDIRTRLTSMIGSLKLIVDGMADSLEEQNELTEEAYYSAVGLIETLQSLETEAKAHAKATASIV